jgi:hypothetical protein
MRLGRYLSGPQSYTIFLGGSGGGGGGGITKVSSFLLGAGGIGGATAGSLVGEGARGFC